MGITSESRQPSQNGCTASPPIYNMENIVISVERNHFDLRSMYDGHEAGPRGRAYSLTYMSVISDSTHPRPIRIIGRWNSDLYNVQGLSRLESMVHIAKEYP
jgi:hypothetical protein